MLNNLLLTFIFVSIFILVPYLLFPSHKVTDTALVIRTGFSKLIIKLEDISEIIESDNYSIEKDKNTSCTYICGAYYGMPDRILIKLKSGTNYFLPSSNAKAFINKIRKSKSNHIAIIEL